MTYRQVTVGWLACALGFMAAGCGSKDRADPTAMGGSGGSDGTAPGTGECNVVLITNPPSTGAHTDECSDIEYSTNPPSGGMHYDVWAAFQTYAFPVPHGYLVHALEHGAVVFWYNCPEGCADEVAEVQAFITARPADVACTGRGAARRAILTPSPTLLTRWAASAWGFALTADCFDEEAFEAFYADHYARGPEDTCAPGQTFTADPCR